jgi:hypothetical protein
MRSKTDLLEAAMIENKKRDDQFIDGFDSD